MATVTLKGNQVNTVGSLPAVGDQAPAFTLTNNGLEAVSLKDFAGKSLVLNIFPSVDTPTCATSVKQFNEKAAGKDAVVLCVSRDLPFAFKRFCAAEGIENVQCASDFRNPEFGQAYGVTLSDGPIAGLFSRAIVVVDGTGKVTHAEQVGEIADEPNYDAALAALG
jgi:thioredoxin-dependent peroxiredoxin